MSQSWGRPKGDTVKGAALFCCQKFLKWEGVHANTAKVSKRSHNRCYGRADNHHQKSLPPKEREKRKREVEQKLFDVFSKYAGQCV